MGREVSNSLGEMAEMAIMKSPELFHLLEKHGHRLIERRFEPTDAADDVPARVLRLSIETMMEELAPNLWEHCLDRLVDFGHAVGQNLEMLALGSSHELMHGEAVATDMAFMTVLSNVIGVLSESDRDRILRTLHTCGLPTWHPMFTRDFFQEALADRIKNSQGMRLPLPVGIGKARMFNDVTETQFETTFVLWERLCKSTTVTVNAIAPTPLLPVTVPGVKHYYTFPLAQNALMVDIFMREKGINTEGIKSIEKFVGLPPFENKDAECLSMNPRGSSPSFLLEDG